MIQFLPGQQIQQWWWGRTAHLQDLHTTAAYLHVGTNSDWKTNWNENEYSLPKIKSASDFSFNIIFFLFNWEQKKSMNKSYLS